MTKSLRFALIAILTTFISNSYAQISSTGKLFYLSFMQMETRTGGFPDSLLVYLTCEKNTTVTIENPRIAGTKQTINITAGIVNRYQADPGFYYPSGSEFPGSDLNSKRSLMITSKDPINVYTLNLEENRSDGTFVLPYESIPKAPEFYITSYTPTAPKGSGYAVSEFVVVAMDNNVEVEITPASRTKGGKTAGTAFSVVLARGQVYQVQSNSADGSNANPPTATGDMTGSRVRVINGCGKINVFAGAESSMVPRNTSCGGGFVVGRDHLYTQVFPTNILGNQHVLMPFKGQSGGYCFRVLAVKDNTKIYVNGTLASTKNKGQWYFQDIGTEVATCVTTDSAAYVIQYMKNGVCGKYGGDRGDAAILIMPDVKQRMLKTVVGTATTKNMDRHFVNILVQKTAINSVKLNGTSVSPGSFTTLTCLPYAYASIQVANPSTNTIESDSGFLVVAYGIGPYESYSYCSGALFENLEYDFSITRTGKCPGQPVTLKAIANNPKIKSYHWEFGDGFKDTGKNVVHSYNRVGTFYTVLKIAITAPCGQVDTIVRSKIIDILSAPLFNIPDTLFRCTDTLKVDFVGPVKNSYVYKWLDSSTSNKFTATSPGKVWFRLYDTTTKCTLFDSTWVKQFNPIKAAISYDTIDRCFPTNKFSLSDGSTYKSDAFASNVWVLSRIDKSTGKRDTTITLPRFRMSFDSLLHYPLKYYVTSKNGCRDSLTTTLDLRDVPAVKMNISTPEYCQRAVVNFRDSSAGEGGIGKSYWDYGDGKKDTALNTVHTFLGYDTFRLKLITETVYGCRDTADSSIVVRPLPVMQIQTTVKSACLKSNSFDFEDKSSIPKGTYTTKWEYTGGSAAGVKSISNINFQDTGNHIVKLINTSDFGCKDSTTVTAYVAPMPKAIISLTDSSKCLNNHFFNLSNASTISKGTIASRSWTFSDGTTSTSNSISNKKFATYGVYNVKLLVTSATYGCKDSINRNLEVFEQPLAPFDVNDSVQCELNNNFSFSPKNTFNTGGVSLQHSWDFGDGGIASTRTATHAYSSQGTYNVKYKVSSGKGCADSAVRVMLVSGDPIASFTSSRDSACLGSHKFTFTNTTTFGGTYSSKWTLGDGNTATSKDVLSKNYTVPRTYDIKLVVATVAGCKDSITKRVVVMPVPQAAFSINNPTQCLAGNSFVFTNNTSTNGATGMQYTWVFTPGTVFYTPSIAAQSMTDTGQYSVELTARSAYGCETKTTSAYYVAESPTVTFTADDACAGESIDFDATALINAGSIANYAWTFGDGGTSSTQDPSHVYNNAGSYNVSVTVTSNKGCTATAGPTPVSVFANPVADFTSVQTLSRGMETDHTITFSGSGAVGYLWSFYDGSTDNSPGPIMKTFTDTGYRPLKLWVINADGCVDSVMKYMYLKPELQMHIPTSFTPNLDGLNEVFGPSTTFGLSKYKMQIFDRWGGKIFETTDPKNGWDGTDVDKNPLPEGVYAYHIVFRYIDGKIFVYKGTLTLIR